MLVITRWLCISEASANQFRKVLFYQLLGSRLDLYHVSALELVTTSIVMISREKNSGSQYDLSPYRLVNC